MVRLRLPLLPSAVRLGMVLLVAAGILYYSTIGAVSASVGGGGGTGSGGMNGLARSHVVGYAILAWVLAYADADADRQATEGVAWKRAAGVIALATLYGVCMELVQLGFADRVFDPVDMVSNGVGAATVLGWYLLVPAVEFVRVGRDTTE